jgi:hypothetical protein
VEVSGGASGGGAVLVLYTGTCVRAWEVCALTAMGGRGGWPAVGSAMVHASVPACGGSDVSMEHGR